MEFSGTIPSSRSESNADAMHLDSIVPPIGAWKNDDGDGSSNGPSVGDVKYNEKKIRLVVAKMIIVDELPFRFVEKQGFKDLMAIVEPRFPIPSRITVMRDCLKIYFSKKDKVRYIFMASSYKICITINMWTSVQNLNYMCIIAHFIDDDWILHKRIIDFMKVSDPKGMTIGREIESSVLGWGIKKIFMLTVDNASSNTTIIDYLRKNSEVRDCMVLDNELMHIRCCACILNLIVHDGMKEIDGLIVKIRNAVKYVKSSPARLDKFKSCVERQNISGGVLLSLDVPTKWNSTYLMLSAALKYHAAFEVMQDEDDQFGPYLCEVGRGGPPTLKDWETIKVFVGFLKIFYNVTLQISSSNATSNLFCKEITTIYNHLENFSMSEDFMLKIMSERMMLKYDKYWGDFEKVDKILFISAMLQVGSFGVLVYKISWPQASVRTCYKVKKMIEQLYKQYSKPNVVSSSFGETQSNTASYDDEDDLLIRYHRYKASKGVVESKSELDQYFMGSLEELTPNFDILMWWKVNSTKFPILANIARDVLVIPISTIAPELAFNIEGRVLDSFRSSLVLTTIEALICTQNWLEAPSINYDSQDIMEDAESYKLENLKNIWNEDD